MKHRRPLLMGVLGLAAIWLVAGVAIAMARSQAVTAASITRFVQSEGLHLEPSPDARERYIDELASQLNRLPHEERQKLRLDRPIDEQIRLMNDAERARFLELTLPTGMKQMMEAFNEMPRERRQQLVDEALAELDRVRLEVEAGAAPEEAGPHDGFAREDFERIVDEGLKAYFSEASSTAKLDLQPLIEQIQALLRGGHHRGMRR